MAGELLVDKMSADDEAPNENMLKDGLEWLDWHQDASKTEMEVNIKEVNNIIPPIVAKGATCRYRWQDCRGHRGLFMATSLATPRPAGCRIMKAVSPRG